MSKTPFYQLPSASTATDTSLKLGFGIVGAKLSDGIAAALPDSTNKYKKWTIAGVAFLGAMCFNPSTTGGVIAQSSLLGMAIKQGADAFSDALVPVIEARTGGTGTDKFINALVGHPTATVTVPTDVKAKFAALNAAMQWEPAEAVEQSPFAAVPVETGMFLGV